MTARAEKVPLELVRDTKDEYPQQIAAARITAQFLVQMPFDAMQQRAEDEHARWIRGNGEPSEGRQAAADKEILAVLAFAQKRLRRIEARYGR